MSLIRRVRWWLALTMMLVIGALWAGVIYPVKLTFDFAYRGQPVHVSTLTLMKAQLCRDFLERCIVEWLPYRYTVSVPLGDDSLLVMAPYWPWSWDSHFGTFRSRAAWIWLDHTSAPTQITMGDGSQKLSPMPPERAPFPEFMVTAKVERVSQLFLLNAFVDDQSKGDADPVVASSRFRLSLNKDGRLFAEIDAIPLAPEGLSQFRDSDSWVNLDGGCRIFFRTLRTLPADKGVIFDQSRQRYLFKKGDEWSIGRGSYHTDLHVLYFSGRPNLANRGSVPDLVRPALSQVHSIEHDGKVCRIAAWPDDSFNAYLDFGDGQIFLIDTSLEWVIARG